MRIGLDPGHDGVIDPGAVGQGGTLESDVALAVCQYAKEFLESNGHQVMMTRSAPDADVNELYVRTAMAQEWGADILVSVHCNSFSDPAAYGTEIWTTRGQDDSDRLATAIFDDIRNNFPQLSARTDVSDGDDDKEAGFAVLKGGMPSSLVELAFISNPEEELMLSNPTYQKLFGYAIATGIQRYAG